MGISGLLPLLEKCTRRCHVSEFRDCTVAVDAYCWLHKGATSCAEQLAKGQHTDMYINYCLKYIKLLLSYNIHVIMVFDGKNLPAKADTELKRRQNRNTAKQRAAELLCLGKTSEAYTYLRQSVDITPQMANALMRECRKLSVDCIVAPYESDAQLAFFNMKGVADFIISEDSDLILFGCSKVLYKMDVTGNGQLVETSNLYQAMNMRPDKYTFDKFRYMCVLSGCDYVDSLPGIGLKKALKFIRLTAETDPDLFLNKLPRYLNMRHLCVTPEYKEKFMVALATFRHQTVFDPFERKLVPLTDPYIHGTNPLHCKNAGQMFDDEKALSIALGNLHPNTLEELDDWMPGSKQSSKSIWCKTYQKYRPPVKVKRSEPKQSIKKIEELKEEDELSKKEYDLKLESELMIYSSNKITDSNAESEQKSPEPTTVNQLRKSPVISKNPFLLKKKLSKFQNTTIAERNIVRSKYFCSLSISSSDNEVRNGVETLNLSEPSECMEEDSTVKEANQDSSNCEEEYNIKGSQKENLQITPSDITTESQGSSKRKRSSESDAEEPIDLSQDCESASNTDNNLSSVSEEINCNKVLENKPKPKIIGRCRRVGLRKQKAQTSQAPQTTLFDMFKKMKKSCPR